MDLEKKMAMDEPISLKKLHAPIIYTNPQSMPLRYRDTLAQMMKSQAYRELAAARLFGYGLQFVPQGRWLNFMVWHICEESEHYFAVCDMYQRFTGESVEPWVLLRLAEKPIPLIASWFELAMAQFLYDRGGFWQLQEYAECSYPAYRQVIEKIIKEKRGHQERGERIVIEACQTDAAQAVKQAVFERWLRQGLLSFRRPFTEGNRYAIENGLKKRDSALVMQDFIDDIKPAVRACGLHFPSATDLHMALPADLNWFL